MQQVSVIDARAYQAACKTIHAQLDDPVEDLLADHTLRVTREVGTNTISIWRTSLTTIFAQHAHVHAHMHAVHTKLVFCGPSCSRVTAKASIANLYVAFHGMRMLVCTLPV